ncbi:signal peptidase I [Atopobacter sp. AH10]|uniref:signal peptidase I n=1 Tax=Atopobacter sp. AH10 TaxID=2315861 RepID=UPI000EF25E57|nr:signal peptidase I [Atopobacter sp. AH10]RLK63394.1 signal peptidase I [Atopobacter sp. AH10]
MAPSDDKHFVSQQLPSRNETHLKKGIFRHKKKSGKRDSQLGQHSLKSLTLKGGKKLDQEHQSSFSRDADLCPKNQSSLKNPSFKGSTSDQGESSLKRRAENKAEERQINRQHKIAEEEMTESMPNKSGGKKNKAKGTESQPLFRQLLDWVFTLAISFLLFWGINNYIAHTYRVSGSSMYPTLQDGERVIANKLEKVDRLDIVVLDAPDATGKEYVKRVIGMPGDKITYVNGKLFVNDKQIKESFTNKAEKFPIDGKDTYGTPNFTLQMLTGEMVVPDGQYFVMGDNRGHSNDSRAFGFVDQEAIHGVVRSIYWPLNKLQWLKTPSDK